MRLLVTLLLAAVLAAAVAAGPAGAGSQRSPDGRYKGPVVDDDGTPLTGIDGGAVSMSVSSDGRRLTRFSTVLGVPCWNGFEYEIRPTPIKFPALRIRRDGRFAKTIKRFDDGDLEAKVSLRGRLQGRRIKSGYLDYFVEGCDREVHWRALRKVSQG